MIVPRLQKNKINNLADFRKSKEYTNYVRKTIKVEFIKIKKKLINDFIVHPVTIEIQAGPQAHNTSKTLSGVGNLFSYIGFNESDRPIEKLLQTLESKTILTSIVFSKNGNFVAHIQYPTIEDIFHATPMPWADGRSWAEGIERGIPGFGSYVNESSVNSRSGHGVQYSANIRGGNFQKTKYMSKIIKNFEKEIHKLNNSKF